MAKRFPAAEHTIRKHIVLYISITFADDSLLIEQRLPLRMHNLLSASRFAGHISRRESEIIDNKGQLHDHDGLPKARLIYL